MKPDKPFFILKLKLKCVISLCVTEVVSMIFKTVMNTNKYEEKPGPFLSLPPFHSSSLSDVLLRPNSVKVILWEKCDPRM